MKLTKIWYLNTFIQLAIFVLGFFIAMWIDEFRQSRETVKLKEHYLGIVKNDVEKDIQNYQNAYEHDSLRSIGCDLVLKLLLSRQRAFRNELGILRTSFQSKKGPGNEFDTLRIMNKGDTIAILDKSDNWIMDSSGAWLPKNIISKMDIQFNWFFRGSDTTIKNRVSELEYYIDETKSVFQLKTGYEGLIMQNTSNLTNHELQSSLSNYYKFGEYVNWLENYYRDSHYDIYNELRFSFGQESFINFIYRLDEDGNNQLIQQLSIAKKHADREVKYYKQAIELASDILVKLNTK